ncbi:hypothetical protein [Amycolatopsis sp. lyj-346]|uniref:hypothetical protein n=1 Tax=Amycolatopsis sp. lyj-346 TaxID=2789289 RepID=UPI00397DE574
MDGTSGHCRQPRQPAPRAQVTGEPRAGAIPADPLLVLQRTAGNAAVGDLLRRGHVSLQRQPRPGPATPAASGTAPAGTAAGSTPQRVVSIYVITTGDRAEPRFTGTAGRHPRRPRSMTDMFRLRARSAGADYVVAASSVAGVQAELRRIAQQLAQEGARVGTLGFVGHGAGDRGDFIVAITGSAANPSRELIDDANFADVVAPLVEDHHLMTDGARVVLEGCWTENGPLPGRIRQVLAQHHVSATVSGFAGQANFAWDPPPPGTRRPRRGPAGQVTVTGTSLSDL